MFGDQMKLRRGWSRIATYKRSPSLEVCTRSEQKYLGRDKIISRIGVACRNG